MKRMTKKSTLLAALVCGLALSLGACGDKTSSGHDHDHDSKKSGSDHDHEHGHGHSHADHGEKEEIGKATLAGVAIVVEQAGDVEVGETSDFFVEIPDAKAVVVRVWFGKADGIVIGSASKPHADDEPNELHAELTPPRDMKEVMVWVEVTAGEGDDAKTEKASFKPHVHE